MRCSDALNIDAKEIFYPEMQRTDPSITHLRHLIESCSEEEASAMIPILKSVLSALRSKNVINIK